MPILAKPTGNLDNPTDGFDPLARSQMIPLLGTREMFVQTGDFKAELKFTRPSVSSMSNFRIVRQSKPSLFPLPGPGVLVDRITLPAQSLIQFTLSGRTAGTTVLEGRDRLDSGAFLAPGLTLEVAVKPKLRREFAVCYIFDQIHRDTHQRVGFGTLFEQVSEIYEQQANLSTINIDGHNSSTDAARTVTLNGTSGSTFNIADTRLLGRVISAFEAQFPGVFRRVHTVLFHAPVPLQVGAGRPRGIQVNLHRGDGAQFQTIFIGSTQDLDPRLLRHTLAHEIGHAFGLRHSPPEPPPGPRPGVQPDPDLLANFMHNLMFPSDLMQSNRITGRQIDTIHSVIPPFRHLDI
jgi:hypothetical protein